MHNYKTIVILVLLLAQTIQVYSMYNEGDSIFCAHITNVPVIDGSNTDACWDSVKFTKLQYSWKPYGEVIDSTDFYGQFKTVWNKDSNLLYFLFEITDDKFVNGYHFAIGDGSYPLFDIVEVFIDENKSGGDHSFTNNAFAYHITGGNNDTFFDVADLGAGTWDNNKVNYKNHFPQFARVKNSNVYTWEFSMMVLKDTYLPTNNPASYKANLTLGKKIGLSAAYCDNDNSAIDPKRDHFIGSRLLSSTNADKSWQDASMFGCMKLVNTNYPSILYSKPTIVINIPDTVLSTLVDLTQTDITEGSTPGLTYTYWSDSAATIELINPKAISVSGTYYIKGTIPNTWISTIKPVKVVIMPSNTIQYSNKLNFIISPNPVSNFINLTFSQITNLNTNIQITNLNGIVKYNATISNCLNSIIDISGLPTGVYFISVIENNKISRGKFVKG